MAYIQFARLVVLLLTVTVSVSVSAATRAGEAAKDTPRAQTRMSVQAQDEEKKSRPGAQRRERRPLREDAALQWLLEKAAVVSHRLAGYAAPARGTLQTLCVRLNN